jgi:hypothetical protein
MRPLPQQFFCSVNRRIRSLIPIGLAVVVSLLALRFSYQVIFYYSVDQIWDMDFFSIWSFAKFVLGHDVSEIYDNSKLLDYQMDLGADPTQRPYAYPPFFLLIILPLGFLPYHVAFAAWDVITLSLYFVASFYRRWRPSAILLTIFAPAALQNFCTGQTGFLSAGLIVGGFRLAVNWPILSGILLGLVSFKPQFGVLIPIALISARLWRTFAAAAATVGVLIVVSSMAFGWSVWSIWAAKLFVHADWAAAVPNRFQPTITANLTFLGVDMAVARMVQMFVAVLIAVFIWFCFRRGLTLLATAALLVGTVLATPYAFLYDLPIVTNAVLMFIRHKDQTNRLLTIPEGAVLLLSLVVPVFMLETWRPAMFRSIPLLLLFTLIGRELFRFRTDAKSQLALTARPRDHRNATSA